MTVVGMILGAVLVYFIISRLFWELSWKMRLQFALSAFLIVLLGYLLTVLYPWWLGMITIVVLLIFFSIIFGKQLEYTVEQMEEENDKKEESAQLQHVSTEPFLADEREPVRESLATSHRSIGAVPEKGQVVDEEQKDTDELSQEDIFFFNDIKRRSFIDDDSEEALEQEEGSVLDGYSEAADEPEETFLGESGIRAQMLEELERENEDRREEENKVYET